MSETAEVQIDYQSGAIQSVQSAETVAGSDPNAKNTLENPCVVTSQPFNQIRINEGRAVAKLPPLSVTAISFVVN